MTNGNFLRIRRKTNSKTDYFYKSRKPSEDRYAMRVFVQRFRANASCVFEGKIQSGFVSCFIQTRGVILNERNNRAAHVCEMRHK